MTGERQCEAGIAADRTAGAAADRGPGGATRFRPLRVIAALVIRETCARFGNARGGYLWALAEPVGGIAVLALAFGVMVTRPPLGDSFIFFYATGILPYLGYSAVASGAMNAIGTNRNLLAYPVVTALDTILARALLDTLTHAVVAAIVFGALLIWLGPEAPVAPERVAAAFALASALGLGIGTLNALLVGLFPAWRQVWSVLNRPLFLASGVLFNTAGLPAGLRDMLAWNPVAHLIAETRAGFYGPDQALDGSAAFVLGVAGLTFVAGAALVRRNESRLTEG